MSLSHRRFKIWKYLGPCSYVCAFCSVHWLKIQIEHKNGLLLFYRYFQLEINIWFSVIISYFPCLCECLVFDSFKVAPAEWSHVSYWWEVCVMASDFLCESQVIASSTLLISCCVSVVLWNYWELQWWTVLF